MAAPNNTGCNEWFTPERCIGLVLAVMGGIDLDPASNAIAQKVVQAARFFTQEDDGLTKPWAGRVFCNPPYSGGLMAPFVDKLLSEIASGNVSEAILLTHNHSDTKWFQAALGVASRVCLTAGRLDFYGANGEIAQPVQGQAFHYFGKNADKFEKVFSSIGTVLKPVRSATGIYKLARPPRPAPARQAKAPAPATPLKATTKQAPAPRARPRKPAAKAATPRKKPSPQDAAARVKQ